MMKKTTKYNANIEIHNHSLILCGYWERLYLDEYLLDNNFGSQKIELIDCTKISSLDTTGVLFIIKLEALVKKKNINVKVKIHQQNIEFYELIKNNISQGNNLAYKNDSSNSTTYLIGYKTSNYYRDFINFIIFLGQITSTSLKVIQRPKKIPGRLILDIIFSAGYQALGIITLLAFLIGIVLAYQMGGQLITYGANIFIVKILGLSLLREFAPLITAIIVAGRSGSAFTAQIGTMKIQEEIDALKTFGISPLERLVLPRLCGLIIALPFLVVLADISSIFGGMVMSKIYLNINYIEFLSQFQKDVSFYSYFIGLIKTPVFALIIASVGCYRGLCVQGHASSIGEETTKSVVYSIFLIIIADAIFSILFSSAGL